MLVVVSVTNSVMMVIIPCTAPKALMINRVWHYFVFLCIGTCYDSWAVWRNEYQHLIQQTLCSFKSLLLCKYWGIISEVYNITKRNITYSVLTIIIIIILKQQVQLVVLCMHLCLSYCLVEITIATLRISVLILVQPSSVMCTLDWAVSTFFFHWLSLLLSTF